MSFELLFPSLVTVGVCQAKKTDTDVLIATE